MNKLRRRQLCEIVARIDAIASEVEALKDAEEDYFENIPDGFAETLRAEESEQAIDTLDSAIDILNEATAELNAILGE